MKKNSLFLARAALVAALYTVITYVGAPISFGPVQLRFSEALCVLPIFGPSAVPGLFAGCFLANFLAGASPIDVVFGSLATLLGAFGTFSLRRRKWLSLLPPIVSNTLIIPWVLRFAYGEETLIPFMMLTIGAGELLSVGVLGTMLRLALEKSLPGALRE